VARTAALLPAADSTVVPERTLGVGSSSLRDSASAGAEAARSASGALVTPALVIVFASDAHDLPTLIGAISDVVGDAPLIGCSTAGEISGRGAKDSTVVVVALGGSGFSIATTSATGIAGRLHEAGAEVASCLASVAARPHRVLMLLSDGLSGDQQQLVRGAYSVAGAEVPLVGGCAGDDLKMRRTHQFHGRQVLEDSVVAAAIASNAPLGIGARHGWIPVGDPVLVTSSAGNRVFTLADRPALDVYLERLGVEEPARSSPAEFTRFAITHPLGIRRRTGEEVRFVGEANFVDRSLGCIANVPQGGLAWFMTGDDDSVLLATDAACADALRSLGDLPPLGFIAFDCIGRRGVLGDQGVRKEIDRISSRSGGAPVAGFYTYGEIARTAGISGFHNQTLVILAIA